MVKLAENKVLTEHNPIQKLALPAKVYIPIIQHLGKPCSDIEVKVGDYVSTGQRIASAQAHVFALVHSSVSGRVLAIEDRPHPVLGRAKAIIIESDGQDKSEIHKAVKSQEQIDKITPQEIRNIVFESGIVGMGGASFPTHIKLNPAKPVDTLIINGAECEPYITSDDRLMVEKTHEIIKGAELVARCLGAKKVYIAIENNKPEAIDKFRAGVSGKGYEVKVLRSEYPQGGEKQLIKNVLGKEVPAGKLPFDIGVVVQNVATVFAIYEAVYLGKPLYERVVTVTGDCLSNPKNLLVRIGTPFKELIEFCSPLKREAATVISGGPMMGVAQFSLDAPVIKSTNALLLLSEAIKDLREINSCIRCSRCVQNCPVGLMPCSIALSSSSRNWQQARLEGCLDCIECGSCNYVCPQKINLVQAIKYAKMMVNK